MVEFGSGYSMPMDREYVQHDHHHEHGFPAEGGKTTNDVGIGMGDLGMSMGLGPVPNVHAIKAKLYPGTKKLEFVFTGRGKGTGQSQTPEMYGFKQRQALVEMGKANRVDFTTHSTVGVYGLAGMDHRSGNFSKEAQNASLQEVKRAIEFAADVARGGPVVVHTGEFQRSSDVDWNKQGKWANRFSLYEGEEKEAIFSVVDKRTGGVLQRARKNQDVTRPVWLTAENDDSAKGVKKGDYVDYFGSKISDLARRVPKYNEATGNFEVEKMTWQMVEHEAQKMTKEAQDTWQQWKNNKISDDEWQKTIWVRFSDAQRKEDVRVRPEEAWVLQGFQTTVANNEGWAHYYGRTFEDSVKGLKELHQILPILRQQEEAAKGDEEAMRRLRKKVPTMAARLGLVEASEDKLPSEVVEEQIRQLDRQLQQAQESASSQWARAEEARDHMRNAESADTYALKVAAQAYADAAILAMRKTQELGPLAKKPLQLALENLFPESYGSHPDELIDLVMRSRATMVEKLKTQFRMSEEMAQKKAEDHITATFDTGHLNMWRRHWKGDVNKSIAENDKEFNTWMLDKIKEMSQKKIIGHVHIDDNYGYHDDHLAPGEGNTPIRDMLKVLKENGYKGEMIIEPGADYTTDQSGFSSVTKTWRHLGIPTYGSGTGLAMQKRTWDQVGYGWFGQITPPYFSFQPYTPSEDWTLWSGVPFE